MPRPKDHRTVGKLTTPRKLEGDLRFQGASFAPVSGGPDEGSGCLCAFLLNYVTGLNGAKVSLIGFLSPVRTLLAAKLNYPRTLCS